MGRYARELVRALVRLTDPPELALYEVGRARRSVDEDALGLPPGSGPGSSRVQRVRSSTPRRLARWSPLEAVRCADVALGGVDLFHHTSRSLPRVARARETLAVSEIPAPGTPEERVLRKSLARADAVLVFSRSARDLLERRFGIDPDRVHRVAVGCEHARRVLGEPPPRESIPRILALGPLHRGRRAPQLLRAFARLSEEGLMAHLHLLGDGGDAQKECERIAAEARVRLRLVRQRSVPEKELGSLIARASVVVHLVEDAATPVTPLEAFSLGTPVVASRLPVYEEALEGRAELVPNAEIDRDPRALADAMLRAIRSATDPLACAARERCAEAFTWERNALETVRVWQEVLARDRVRSSRR